MRECPGVYFATEPAGRTAKISGTGLGVWEVFRDFVRDADLERVRRAFPQLSSAQLTAALIYFRRISRGNPARGRGECGADSGGA